MYSNRTNKQHPDLSRSGVVAIAIFICLLEGCAKSRHRTGTEDAADSAPAEIADSGASTPDSDQKEKEEEPDASEGSFYPHDSGDDFLEPDFPSFGPPPDPPEPPTEVQEAMEKLDEPDFARPLDELAKEHCGYIFKAESTIDWVSRYQYVADTTTVTVETRVFDNAGRLVAAEIEWDANADPSIPTLINNTRRIQIDYDQNARPMLIRIRTISNDQTITPIGSVIKTEYESDGSSRSLYTTNETSLIVKEFDPAYSTIDARNGWFFCDWLHFDSHGNLIDRKWDCDNPTTVQERRYDDQHRLISDHGFYLDNIENYRPIPKGWKIQQGPWRIEIKYDDINHRATVVWLGPEESTVTYSVAGMTPSDEPIEHRLVRNYDDSGQRLVRVEYDHENDGTFDEQISYTYEEGELLTKEADFWIDGVADIVEIHTRSSDRHRIERRNLTASSDVMYSSQTDENRFIYAYSDINSTLPPQSQSTIELERDGQLRLVAAELDAQWIDHYVADTGRWESAAVSESWHEQSTYAEKGYVSEKELIWEPSVALLDAQTKNTEPARNAGVPFIFEADAVSTTCTLTPLCDDAQVVLPEDHRLLTCEVGVVFSQYRIIHRIPSLNQDDLYTLPPYDRLPGMQQALKRDSHSYTFPRAPFIQDLVDYL